MSNSKLICMTKLSPNCNHPRNHTIDTITIHHMAGNMSIENCLNMFANSSRAASANYVIGTDGRIGLCVNECDRAWTSGNRDNDHRAITIEVANDNTSTYTISAKAMESLINLCADICKRNGIKQLLWKNDKNLIGNITRQNMTVHRWFQATACPGDYLMSKMGYIADSVNKKLGVSSASNTNNAKKYNGVYPTLPARGWYKYGDGIRIYKQYADEIKKVQMFMNWALGCSLVVDGMYGKKTQRAVAQFQAKVSIKVDGAFGNDTLKKAKAFTK